MSQQAIVETIFKSVLASLPIELGTLLGQELTCSDSKYQISSKTDLFASDIRPKSTVSHLNIVGDHEGQAFLIMPIRTSVIFGGTLIMLPKDQIEESAKEEQFEGEVADAYGEVANIIAGVMTQVFLDKYSKSLRFVRTEVEVLDSSSIDITSEALLPSDSYFTCSSQLAIGDQALGCIEIIVPVEVLDLEEAQVQTDKVETPTDEPAPAEAPPVAEVEAAVDTTDEVPAAPAKKPFADAKKIADVVLKATVQQTAEEVGALLGQTFVCSDLKLEMVSKADFLGSHCLEKSVLTKFNVSGGTDGNSYLFHELKNAILMGGTLIMLPEEEITESMGKERFDGEVADAYGEVANIISGGLTQTFMDRFTPQLRFVKTTSETIVPTKLTPTEDVPFPDGLYYLASCNINLQGTALDKMHLLFPAEILGLEEQENATAFPDGNSANQKEVEPATQTETQPTGQAASQVGNSSNIPPAQAQPPANATPVVLVITDAPEEAESISLNIKSDKYEVKIIGYKDDVRTVFSAHPVLGVFLLMSEVGEKGFSVAIKLQSSGYKLPPVIAGGPEWTRSAVLKAIKYGARDILVTPASDDEIRDKASQHISAPA